MISSNELYSQMRVTTDAAHSGTHSLTTDSSMTALDYREPSDSTVEKGIVGVEFYMMAKTLSQINFGAELGKDPGSSGAVTPAFGIFFDPSDSIKCTAFANSWPYSVDSQTMVAKIQAGHWYKCKVEFNFSDSTVIYDIDDVPVLTNKLAKSNLDTVLVNAFPMGINRLLIFRGTQGRYNSTSSEGAKPYYIDDITFYKK
jgi:hypothetical protein